MIAVPRRAAAIRLPTRAGASARPPASAPFFASRSPPVLALLLLATLALGAAAATGVRAGWMGAKAALAQHLLERAWEKTLATGTAVRPWPWADVAPMARLRVPSLERSLIVLQDASGEALAFGPGLVAGSPARAADAALAIGGHRDSHLAFLEHLPPGARLTLETRDGARHRYRVAATRIVDSSRQRFGLARDRPGLALITCYPFRATQTGGPLRYVAVALPVAPAADDESARRAGGTRRAGAIRIDRQAHHPRNL